MPMWEVEVTIVEHCRLALIEADSKTEALAKLRANEWEELGDARRFTVTKSGRLRRTDWKPSGGRLGDTEPLPKEPK